MSALSIKALGPVALDLLKKRHPVRHPAVEPAVLKALLAKAKVPGHAPATAFERAYGGLSFPEHGEGRGWRKADVVPWLVGPAACLSTDESFHPPGKRKLVPVLCTANDVVYFLDADGAGWGQDTIEDARPVLVAPNARALMSRVLFWQEVLFCPDEKKVTLASAQGATVAAALALAAVADASDATERWWSDGKTFVVEKVERSGKRGAISTTIAHPPKGALARIGLEEPTKPPKHVGPVTFDSVLAEYASVILVTTVVGKLDATWRAFFEPSRHTQPCTIELRVGGAVSFANGKLAGTIAEIDETRPGAVRVRLALADSVGFMKKTSRVELFFREIVSSTLVNVFQFDVKDRHVDVFREAWSKDVLDAWRST